MANSSKPLAFNLSDKELDKRIEQYKSDLNNDLFCRASWPHFCSYLGFTEKEVKAVITRGSQEANAYTRRSQALKRMLTWIRGEMLSGKGWSGQNQTKAIFALKQDMGDGLSYADTPKGNNGTQEIKISFGNGDSRSKKAAK